MTSDVYNFDRVHPSQAPEGFKDDVAQAHYVPAPCQVACPIGTDAPSYIGYIWEGKTEEAFEAITATNPFSSICGRVCDAPCEPACRRADSDGPIGIRNLKRYVMDQLGKDYRLPVVDVSQTKSVAVVGAGPAGMTAAQDLAEAGFEVHIYEMTDRLGGMMTWGIPEFRLPKGTISEDIDRMLAHCPGIKVHLNTPLADKDGDDGVTLDELKERHAAVLLTIGAWWGKNMKVPGDDHSKVIDGVQFLRKVNDGERPELPETVTVIGGGDVAMDACRAALRLPGCKYVNVVYRRGEDGIPARLDELEGAIKEGVKITYNTQPVGVIPDGDNLKLRCIRTEPGEPGEDGRRRPVDVPGSEHDIDCGMVIMAVGQQSISTHLETKGLMDGDRVKTNWDGMTTQDPKVFAAGDGAFGGSTIVMAMQHGHRSAYYIKAFLEGQANPVAYRVPFRTRTVPIAQDPEWEIINRQEQDFHGLGDDPVSFPEIESHYTERAAKCEAARCYRCDVETGASDYSVSSREDIFVMARTNPEDARTQNAILDKRLVLRDNPYPEGSVQSFEDLVFLPANLSRLVIDPYRDACNVSTTIAGKLTIATPGFVAGFDDAPDEVREDVGAGIADHGSAYIGKKALNAGGKWLQLVEDDGAIDDTASGFIALDPSSDFKAIKNASGTDKLSGVVVTHDNLQDVLTRALAAELDIILLDGTANINAPWSELNSGCDLALMRDVIKILRGMNREEDLEPIYFGGVRSGTDVAKTISLGCRAGVFGVAAAMATGGTIEDGMMQFYSDFNRDDRKIGLANLLQASSGEASIMARCTGKTNVHNLEPEDLRSVTIVTARASGIPVAGTNRVLDAAQ